MPNAGPGWFDDGSGQQRWWDGERWTTFFFDRAAQAVVDRAAQLPANGSSGSVDTTPTKSKNNLPATVITLAVVGVVILALWGWGGLLVVSGLIAGTVGLYALLRGSFSRLRIQTRPVGVAVLVAGIVVASVGGAAVAANQPADHDVAAFVDAGVASPRASASAPTPTPTPVRKETIVEESAPIAFSTSNVDDPNLDVGLTALATAGADGQKVIRTRVVTVDGVEVSREVVEEIVTVQPVNEIIAVGSRQPPPPPPAPVDNGCDSNYEGACVPISSDVDCAGGSGNGPAYVQGPVWIVGSDIYDLDRDGDGVACDA